jgi:hypothetical protein
MHPGLQEALLVCTRIALMSVSQRRCIRTIPSIAVARPISTPSDKALAVVTRFDDEYWLARDEDGEFPKEFHRAMADNGWLGITMPEEQGGAGLGVAEAAVMMHEVSSHGGGMAAASSVHVNLFGPHPIVIQGTPAQKAEWIPALIAGTDQCCSGFTEPDAGLDTARIKTFAERAAGGYIVHGQKLWTSTAQVANKIMLLTRTTRYEDARRPDRRHNDLLHGPRSFQDRGPQDPENGTQGRRFERAVSTRFLFPKRIGSARKAEASATFSIASIPSVC